MSTDGTFFCLVGLAIAGYLLYLYLKQPAQGGAVPASANPVTRWNALLNHWDGQPSE